MSSRGDGRVSLPGERGCCSLVVLCVWGAAVCLGRTQLDVATPPDWLPPAQGSSIEPLPLLPILNRFTLESSPPPPLPGQLRRGAALELAHLAVQGGLQYLAT